MGYRLEWGWDVANVGQHDVTVTDGGGAFTVSITSGLHFHTAVSSATNADGNTLTRLSDSLVFASELETALNAQTASGATYTVSYSDTAGYTISIDSGTVSLTFTGDNGTRMRQALGFQGSQSAAASQTSNARPYYLLIPKIAGRTNETDEYDPDDIASESVADSENSHHVRRKASLSWFDWDQVAEEDDPPATAFATGCPMRVRHATAVVPWSWHAAFKHAGKGDHPFALFGNGDSTTYVHRLRAEGMAFAPKRWSAPDFGLWSVPLMTRLLGTF